jgi:hypothetical protein
VDETRRRVEALEKRVAALEGRTARRPATSASDLAQVEQLRRRSGPRYARAGMRGAVAYAGALRSGGREAAWIKEHGAAELLDADAGGLARVLAALAHPARVTLTRALLAAPRTSQELQSLIGASSAGPLYHHLKGMVAAGLVTQSGRSRYEVPAERAIPLLVVLAAAGDLLQPDAAEVGRSLKAGGKA